MNNEVILHEAFNNDTLYNTLKWRCEPKRWSIDTAASQLVMYTDQETDYWQRTHYGFQNDNGHFLYTETAKNFRMTTRVHAEPQTKYDQAGLMIRFSEDVWLKTSMEYIPGGRSKLGAVVTNGGYSDWSTQFVNTEECLELFYRISRIGQNVYVDFSSDGSTWNQIRIAHLEIPDEESIMAGVYACSPQGENQAVRFDYLTIEELSGDPEEVYL
ncbi:hypothetical protein CR205_13115 [Alteribacter lacisalsi]|uniref:DUF1349 domain-containing protein n=1 Tax=Alteribacter lacisalsi TaxID=2045244 RepID=A0A2W0H699_9BACI|nr:DUF1349 domain-containing protein [Alteribacter lacisalsi]PYZ96637.1 hypothetical protein CR205_13115 [Alteribacter lacisalsi]